MRTAIDVPFRDAAATDLGWSFAAGVAPPTGSLAALRVGIPGGELVLHVLGASHAVGIVVGDARATETVACGVPAGRALADAPRSAEAHGLRYRFAARVERPGRAAVEAEAGRLARDLGADPRGLLAVFPGRPGAVTGLRASDPDDDPGWRTWHCYPERSEIVRTWSSVAAATVPLPRATAEVPA